MEYTGTLTAPESHMGTFQQVDGSGMSAEQKTEIVKHTNADLSRLRYYRRQFDQRFTYFYREYLSQRDQRYFPDNITPRSNTFVPYALSNVETITSHITNIFFALDDWFEVRPRSAIYEDAARKMQIVLKYLLSRAKIAQAIELLIRNIAIYGEAGLKIDWDWDYETVILPQPIPMLDASGQPMIDPQTGQPAIQGYKPTPTQIRHNCPRITAIDCFDLLIDPDDKVTGHLVDKTWAQLKREFQASPEGAPKYYPEAMQQLQERLARYPNPDEVIVRLAEVWDSTNNTWTIVTFGMDADTLAWKDLRAQYRAQAYTPYRRSVYGGETVLLWHDKNPFAHQRCPIVHTSFIKLPNEAFGMGVIEIISDLNEAMNRFINMITDNWNLGINKRYAYNVNTDMDHDALNNANVPGGKVGVNGNPQEAVFPLPSFTPAEQDYLPLQVYRDMIQVASGISDFYSKGLGTPTGNRTATGINQVMQESNSRLQMFIRNIELDIMQPLLEMCASMVQQYITDPFEVEVTGEQPGIPKFPLVRPEELYGLFGFDVVSANYATNKFVRQRNFMALANIIAQSPYVNEYEALKEMLKVFDVQGIGRLLKTPQQVMMEQQEQVQQSINMKILETLLDTESKSRIAMTKASVQGKTKEGRPRKAQFEGKIPGTGMTGMIREVAQAMGGNASGLEGIGELMMPETERDSNG